MKEFRFLLSSVTDFGKQSLICCQRIMQQSLSAIISVSEIPAVSLELHVHNALMSLWLAGSVVNRDLFCPERLGSGSLSMLGVEKRLKGPKPRLPVGSSNGI